MADVKDFWCGQKEIQVLDPNITACREKRDLLRQYRETGALIEFNQGLDIRCLNDADIEDLNGMKLKRLHFAWDNPADNLEDKFRRFSDAFRIKDRRKKIVYCLTNFEDVSVAEHVERALYRIYKLCEIGYDPFLMVYDKEHAPRELKRMQRWCNNKWVFGKCRRFEDYE